MVATAITLVRFCFNISIFLSTGLVSLRFRRVTPQLSGHHPPPHPAWQPIFTCQTQKCGLKKTSRPPGNPVTSSCPSAPP
jgi:hypothetical protein